MARLSSPPDPLHATPLADRTSATTTTTTTTDSAPPMSSPTLCPLSLEVSLQSHGSDNLPPSPRRRSSDRPSLLPADCHTLSKILRDVSNNSPPATPSQLEPGEQLFLETGHTSSATNDDPQDEEEGYHLVDDEAADTGYEDEDDSMELSEGVEGTTAEDTIEDVMNLPDKRALPACPSDLSRGNSHRQPVPDDIEQLNRLRLSMEKVLEDERVEQEQAECIVEPGVFIPASNVPQDVTIGVEGSDVGGFDADNEHSIAEAPWTAYTKASQDFVSKRPNCYTPALIRASPAGPALPTRCPPTAAPVSSPTNNKSYPLVPNTPTPSLKVADRDHSQLAANQIVPETPFTKTLSFFKQYKGSENFSSKRRRNTALPQEISDVAGIAVDVKGKTDSSNEEETQNAVPPSSNTDVTPVKSAVLDLEDLMPSKVDGTAIASRTVDRIDKIGQTRAATNSTVGEGPNEGKTSSEPVQNDTDTQKQLIIYPQHPAFVNAIGMIPATMFWVAAAPVVKYANIAVDLLIDKLRDTYL